MSEKITVEEKSKADAIATVEFLITSAMVKTTFQTGIQLAGRRTYCEKRS